MTPVPVPEGVEIGAAPEELYGYGAEDEEIDMIPVPVPDGVGIGAVPEEL